MYNIVHCGLAKSASTTLQRSVFPHLPSFNYLGKTVSKDKPDRQKFGDRLLDFLLDPNNYPMNPQSNQYRAFQEELKLLGSEQAMILSEENIGITPFLYLYMGILDHWLDSPKYLVVIRSQMDILLSLYKYKGMRHLYAPRSIKDKVVSFAEWMEYLLQKDKHPTLAGEISLESQFLSLIDYHNLYQKMAGLVGRERVIFYPFEALVNDQQAFAEHLAKEAELPHQRVPQATTKAQTHNVSKHESQYFSIWLASRLGLKNGPGLGLGRLASRLTGKYSTRRLQRDIDAIRPVIDSRYALGNRQLSADIGWDLEKYGYAVPRP